MWHGRAQEYKVEYKRSNETWLECQRRHTGSGSPSVLVISGLRKGSKYVFRLYAAFERGVFEGPGVEHTFKTKKGAVPTCRLNLSKTPSVVAVTPKWWIPLNVHKSTGLSLYRHASKQHRTPV
ncbi:unnamed protein product [Ascophyllum nodosum]